MREAIAYPTEAESTRSTPAAPTARVTVSPPSPAPAVIRPAARDHLTPGELERLTGIAEERLRSWSRRFSYPTVVSGRRRYLASEVPGLIATKQLIASGLPVGAAIDEARRREAGPLDLGPLATAFDGHDVAVVGFQTADPATTPLARVYANEAAGPEFPQLSDATAQELLRMASHDHEPRLVWIETPGAKDQEHEAMAFTLGAPTFSPAVVIVMELPREGRCVRSRDDLLRQRNVERAAANGLAQARRQLQVHGGATGLRPAFDAICEGVGAQDGFIAFRYGAALQGSISLRGRMLPSRIPLALAQEIDAAALADRPTWLERPVVEALGGEGSCLAIPLKVAGVEFGYACLQFAGPTTLTPATQELLMSFGVMYASVMARERR
ncbi:MAG: hypothetical protein Q7T55_03940 [Solirubrobacteraceae bacterium]|nr:hypothetical protein [Solirubrobacteraceae bacterium]